MMSDIKFFLITILIGSLFAAGHALAGNLVWCLHDDGRHDSHIVAGNPLLAEEAGRQDGSNHCGFNAACAEAGLHLLACVHIPLTLSAVSPGAAPGHAATALAAPPLPASVAMSAAAPDGAQGYCAITSLLPAPALALLRTVRLLC
jgi:hypothetical protein